MHWFSLKHYLLCGVLLAGGCLSSQRSHDPALVAETKAVEFLKQEVPAWSRDNGCFSCHNNGDAARALHAASRKGHRMPAKTLADTVAWVTQPTRWNHNGGNTGFADHVLANVQFSASLLAARESGRVKDDRALTEAIARLLAEQDASGAWIIGPKTALATPATYGAPLATYMALAVLRKTVGSTSADAIRKAEAWLRQVRPTNLPAAAAILLAFSGETDSETVAQRAKCLDLIARGQSPDGGWGPYTDSPPEVFDTAIVLLALQSLPPASETKPLIEQGRAYIVREQLADGSWPETTRPSGNISYAQRLSTAGWATLALLATRD